MQNKDKSYIAIIISIGLIVPIVFLIVLFAVNKSKPELKIDRDFVFSVANSYDSNNYRYGYSVDGQGMLLKTDNKTEEDINKYHYYQTPDLYIFDHETNKVRVVNYEEIKNQTIKPFTSGDGYKLITESISTTRMDFIFPYSREMQVYSISKDGLSLPLQEGNDSRYYRYIESGYRTANIIGWL